MRFANLFCPNCLRILCWRNRRHLCWRVWTSALESGEAAGRERLAAVRTVGPQDVRRLPRKRKHLSYTRLASIHHARWDSGQLGQLFFCHTNCKTISIYIYISYIYILNLDFVGLGMALFLTVPIVQLSHERRLTVVKCRKVKSVMAL